MPTRLGAALFVVSLVVTRGLVSDTSAAEPGPRDAGVREPAPRDAGTRDAGPSSRGGATETPAAPVDGRGADAAKKAAGNVLTFYGLRKLEDDPTVSDAEKLREWEAFVERSAEQVQYAKKAVERWRSAARIRLIEGARAAETDPRVSARERAKVWQEFVRLYPRDPEAPAAKRRAALWTQEEAQRLILAAEEVERARRPKLDRIRAWLDLLAWVQQGPGARAANKRVQELQDQLYAEAEAVDVIARVDDKTKLAAWRDVLLGRPTERQRRAAERRVAELEGQKTPAPDAAPPN